MNDEIKEILIDLLKHNKTNRGDRKLADLAERAKRILDGYKGVKNKTLAHVEPLQTEADQYEFNFKDEFEW